MKDLIRRRGPDGKDIVKDVDHGPSGAVPKYWRGGWYASEAPRLATATPRATK